MLRHYEALGLVRPSGRTGSGYREYSGADIRRIFHVESLRSLGLSLREIRRALDEPGCTPSALVGDLIRQTRERLAAETELLTRLRRIDAVDPAGWEDVLRIVALLQALGSPSPGARQHAALLSASSAGPSSSAAPSASAAPSSSAASSASSASPAPPASPASPADEVPVEVPVPVDALVEAVLNETEPNVAGALRWALAPSTPPLPPCGSAPSAPSPNCPAPRPPPSCAGPWHTPMPWSAHVRRWNWEHAEWPRPCRRSST